MKQYVKILFPHDAFGHNSYESMWAYIDNGRYKIDNIPFYVKNFSWGDIVTVQEIEGELYIHQLVEESGHSTVSVLLPTAMMVDKVRAWFKRMGCDTELSNMKNLIAVDIPASIDYTPIKHKLEEGQQLEQWEYQEACISHKHRALMKMA